MTNGPACSHRHRTCIYNVPVNRQIRSNRYNGAAANLRVPRGATGNGRAPSSRPLALAITTATGQTYVPFLDHHLRAAHGYLKPPLAELSLALVGDKRMADLHEQFLNIPGPTDVLTFPLEADERGRVISGEVVVCVPEARRRAHAEGHTADKELLLYALHGMLHLCGFDDRTDAGFAAMHRTEDKILTALGVGPVFAPAVGGTTAGRAQRARTSPTARAPARKAGRHDRHDAEQTE